MRRPDEGFAMPLGSSPYQEPPYPAGRNAELLVVEFEAGREGMEREVPEPLELVEGSRPIVWVFDAPQLTGSVYHEGAVLLTVSHHGRRGYYVPYLWGDNDEALLLNREVYGWPQLLCDPGRLRKEGNLVSGEVTRRGELLIRASLFIERGAKLEEAPFEQEWLQVRKFPNPVRGKPAVRQLVRTVIPPGTIHELWTGRASLTLGPSAQFALERLAPTRVVRGFYMRTSFELPPPAEVLDAG